MKQAVEQIDRAALRSNFNVSLPASNLVKLRRLTLFEESVAVSSNSDLMVKRIGSFSYIGRKCELFSTESIGRYCSFGQEILAGAGQHPVDWMSTSTFFYRNNMFAGHPEVDEFYAAGQPSFRDKRGEVRIGNDVWIGSRAVILSNISVGHGAVIGAGAIVTKDIEPYMIVAGVPAKVIRRRFDDAMVSRLLESEWWNVRPTLMKGMDFSNVGKMLDEIDRIKQGQNWEYKPKSVSIGPTMR